MADDLDFDSFDNLDDLDWSEIEKDVKDSTAQDQQKAAPAAAPAAGGGEAPAPRPAGSHIDIDYLMDVNLQVTVEIGRKQYFISELLSWGHGGIIALDKAVGEPLNVLVNNKPVAKGEVVVVNDKFALKITEIIDPHDRINYLSQ